MDHVKFFKDLSESICYYRKIVNLMFLIEIDINVLQECGYIEIDIIRLSLEFIFLLMEENEEYLDYIKNEEEADIGRTLGK